MSSIAKKKNFLSQGSFGCPWWKHCFFVSIERMQRRWTSLIFPNNRYLLHINLDNGVTLRKKYPKSSRKLSTLSNVTTRCPEKLTKSCLNLSQLWPKYCRSLYVGHGVCIFPMSAICYVCIVMIVTCRFVEVRRGCSHHIRAVVSMAWHVCTVLYDQPPR